MQQDHRIEYATLSHRASDELMKRYNKPRAFMGPKTYLFEGLKYQRHYDNFHFETAEMLQEFEQRVHSWEMRDEMREDYERMDDEAKSKMDGPIIEYLQKCPHCKIHQFYACRHISYEDVVKLHDLICNTPPPLVCFPSQEIMRKFNALPENIQRYLKQGCPSDLDFKTDEQRTVFEEQVEVETLRQEILYRYNGMSEEKRKEISPNLKTIFSKIYLPGDFEDEWILDNVRFSMEQMRQIHSIVFPPKVHPLSSRMHKMTFPTVVPPEEDYISRATALLHDVADIAVQNRRMADYIVGPCLKKFAATIIKSVDNFSYLEILEEIVCLAKDPTSCFYLLFDKHEKLTVEQKDIIIGLIDIPFEAKSRNIEFIAHSSLRIKGQPAEKILVEFLKRI